MDMFFLSVVNGAFIWILWPERASDAFREISIGDDSGLESAYAALDAENNNGAPAASAPLSSYTY